jgi:predicted HAD superfamily Cof-like phosphohydrolase
MPEEWYFPWEKGVFSVTANFPKYLPTKGKPLLKIVKHSMFIKCFSKCNLALNFFTMNIRRRLTLHDTIDCVREFHDAFLISNHHQPTVLQKPEEYELRHRLMHEENEEYLEACKKGDIVEIADALGDQLYILCGTILRHGLQHKIEEVFLEIQRSNMSKLDENGKPIFREDGKVMKSNLYFKPDIRRIIHEE